MLADFMINMERNDLFNCKQKYFIHIVLSNLFLLTRSADGL